MTTTCICEGASLTDTIRQDVDRYVFGAEREGRSRRTVLLRVFLLSPGLWTIIAHRVTHYSLTRIRPRPLAALIGGLAFAVLRLLHLVTGIEIDTDAHIGPGLLIPHCGTIVIGAVRMGRCCNIAQGVTLGRSTMNDPAVTDVPMVGDRVWIGPGAVIAGPLTIGHDAVIGANSLLTRDVLPGSVVLGVPARVVSQRGSFAQVAYRTMGDDVERAEALRVLDGAPS